MRAFGLLLTAAFAVACLGAEKETAKNPPEEGLTFQGKTLDQWTALAKDKEQAVRIDAAQALGKIGPAAIPALTELLRDKEETVRKEAIGALLRIAVRSGVDGGSGVLKRERGKDAPRAVVEIVTALAGKLDDAEINMRRGAASVLAEVFYRYADRPNMAQAAKDVVPALVKMLQGEDALARSMAVRAVECIGPAAREAVPALMKLLDDEQPRVRIAAAHALRAIERDTKMGQGVKAAIPALIQTLQDKEAGVRCAAASALGAMGQDGKAAIPALARLVSDQDWPVRSCVVAALQRMGPESVPTLTRFLSHPDPMTRAHAASNLGFMGAAAKEAVPALTKLLQDDAGVKSRDREDHMPLPTVSFYAKAALAKIEGGR